MKHSFIFFLVVLTGHLFAQPLQIGDRIPPLSLVTLDGQVLDVQPDQMGGQALLLDFWATWCRPCIAGMSHLDELQTAFDKKLRVVAISDEDQVRLLRFRDNITHNFLFARDTGTVRELFPYQTIPHSVLIDASGMVVAITSPGNITHAVIEKVINGEAIHLPIKEDRLDFDPSYDYFRADTFTRRSFQLQPSMPALPTFSKRYWDGPFMHRRFTAMNMTIAGLYRHAYEVSSQRLVLEIDEALVDWENEQNRYCLDIIVDDPSELMEVMREQLAENVSIQARLEKRAKDVIVIHTLAGEVIATESEPTGQYSGRGDGFSSNGATMDDFCSYLENFGIFGYPVVNETGVDGAFEMAFSFDPENSDSFKEAMKNYGLAYTKVTRDIEVLVLYLQE